MFLGFHKKSVIIMVLSMLLLIALSFGGCGSHTGMPFNGQTEFHKISVTIPESYIRDSTQSSEDVWVFERGFYAKCIILSRSDISGDATASLEGYADYMNGQGAASAVTAFLDSEAVHSTYTKDGVYCQEMLFAYEGSFYAIALRGGDENDFRSLLDTVKINETIAT